MNRCRYLTPLLIVAIVLPACSISASQKGPASNLKALDLENALSMEIALPTERYSRSEQQKDFVGQMLQRVSAVPQVTDAAAIDVTPFSERSQSRVVGVESPSSPRSGISLGYAVITPDYFRVVRIPLMAGRQFTESDTSESPGAVIIGEGVARDLFPQQDPIGKRISLSDGQSVGPWLTVVGVVGDVKDAAGKPITGIYVAFNQNPTATFSLLVRANSEPKNVTDIVRREIQVIDREISITNLQTFSK